jgi:pimeloyl-ACP methyl ester carboxylesterase
MTELRSTRPILNGYRHWLVEAGPSGGLPVVLVHGFPFSHAAWLPQIDALSDRYRVVAYDLRGLGRTEVGDGQFALESYVDDLVAVLNHLGEDRAVVCGLSMGGYVALRAVEREPSRIRALVLCDTRSGADGNEGKISRAESVADLKRSGMGPFTEAFLPKVLGPTTLGERPEVVSAVEDMVRQQRVTGVVAAQLAMAGRTDTTESLHAIEVPALILVGEEDTLTPPAQAREMAARIPGAELEVIPGAGHLSNLENPQAFNAALAAFLSGLEDS